MKISRTTLLVLAELALGFLCCGLSLVVFVKITQEIQEVDTVTLDMLLAQLVYHLRTPMLTIAMKAISWIGYPFPLIGMAGVTAVCIWKRHTKEALLFCLALLIGLVLNTSLKLAVQRPRPQLAPLVIERSYSFPSGHAMNSLIFFALLSYFSYHFFRSKVLTVLITMYSVVIVGLIGFSRVYLGVHYASDVVAGYVAGFWWFVTLLMVEKTLVVGHLFRKNE